LPRILVFKHVAAEPLGTLDPLIRARGHRIRFANFERHPDARPSVDRYRGLIILGGPMNVGQQRAYPHLRHEMTVIEDALAQGKPVLGICLGAQLLAHVLGADVPIMNRPEIGWYTLRPTPEAASDPVLGALQGPHPMFQWHECMFELPEGTTRLAETDGCANQAFRYGESDAWGFQFHMEMDVPLIHRWLSIPAYRKRLERADLGYGPEQIRTQTERHIAQLNQTAGEVFNRFLDRIGRPKRRAILPSR
jgi:GMP synthase (glutamine-hydrolysing)